MSARDTLIKARGVIDRDGFAKHSYEDGSGRHCMQGAILEALGCLRSGVPVGLGPSPDELSKRGRAVREANLALAEQLPEASTDHPAAHRVDSDWATAIRRIVAFNNAKQRRKAQVLAAFDRAVSAAVPEGGAR